MTTYLIRRIIQTIPTLLGVTLITFLLIFYSPGDPIDMFYFDPNISAEDKDRMRSQLCLDRPGWEQYLYYMVGDRSGECPNQGIIFGDFGESIANDRPVLELYREKMWPTLQLTLGAMVIGTVVGIALGIISAIFRATLTDNIIRFMSVLFDAIPSFFLGIMLIIVFGVNLGWFPLGGMVPIRSSETVNIWVRLHHLVLPTIVLGVGWIAVMSRYMRAETLEVLGQDYVRTAKSKGLSGFKVYFKHAARNALIPIVTIIGPAITALLGGSVVIERIFSWPGMGRMVLEALAQRDFPVVMAVTIISAVLVIAGNLLADILLVMVDPRVRLS
ncbi:MAG: ABC transporter permease [Chloroflexota bacterium]